MKKKSLRTIVAAALVFTAATAIMRAADDKITNDDFILSTVTAKVENVDVANREIMLAGPLGEMLVMSVGKNVTRLNDIKPGDYITTDYYLSTALDVRKPTQDELVNTYSMTDFRDKAPAGLPPETDEIKIISVTGTVEGLNINTSMLAFRGPRDNHYNVIVRHPEVLKEFRIDDKVRVTCTQAIVRSVVKASDADAKKAADAAAKVAKKNKS